MDRWFQEEVAGDRYIFDRGFNPVVLGVPQGPPVFVIPGEHAVEAQRACDAHNNLVSERDRYRHRAMEAEHRLAHPPLAENQDELACACYEAYMRYESPESLLERPWDSLGAWESYSWRLAANAVREIIEAGLTIEGHENEGLDCRSGV